MVVIYVWQQYIYIYLYLYIYILHSGIYWKGKWGMKGNENRIYRKVILSDAGWKTLSVGELKSVLKLHKEDWSRCIEKKDMINLTRNTIALAGTGMRGAPKTIFLNYHDYKWKSSYFTSSINNKPDILPTKEDLVSCKWKIYFKYAEMDQQIPNIEGIFYTNGNYRSEPQLHHGDLTWCFVSSTAIQVGG